ncbi:hypothetical protein D9613_003460 [Agrocybe pediades]|uniref:F-box domain-containing protein n=1 Tax=Agrocybe pediades TaxID=84607 RepID=A0A8H4QPL0_9AGAR|nr:hypothetical protein D9613_003460 [Agrocybe pediades]
MKPTSRTSRQIISKSASDHVRHSQILSLPVEITAIIFKLVCRARSEGSGNLRKEVALSHACRSWRALALARPEHWTYFHSNGEKSSELKRFQAYLERSKDKPLEIEFKVSVKFDIWAYRGVQRLLKEALKHTHRWRHFSLVSHHHDWYAPDLIQSLHAISSHRLESLQISLYAQSGPIMNGGPLPGPPKYIRGDAPNLSALYLDETWFAADPSWLLLLPNLKTLQIHAQKGVRATDGQVPAENTKVIFMCRNLESLSTVWKVFQEFGNTMPSSKVTAHKLKNIRCGDENILRYLFHCVNAPSLELLVVHHLQISWNIRIADIVDSNNGRPLLPALRTLAFVNCVLGNAWDRSERVFYDIARLTETNERLYITGWLDPRMENQVFEYMAKRYARDGTILFPALEELYCASCQDNPRTEEIKYSNYLDVVRSRTERSVKKHCTLHLYEEEADSWKSKYPTTWRALEQGDYYRRIPEEYPDGLDLVPWPARVAHYEECGWESFVERFTFSLAGKR